MLGAYVNFSQGGDLSEAADEAEDGEGEQRAGDDPRRPQLATRS